MKDLANAKLLGDADLDRITSVVSNLLEEVIALSERVAKLEGNGDPNAAQDRINEIIERVLTPLA